MRVCAAWLAALEAAALAWHSSALQSSALRPSLQPSLRPSAPQPFRGAPQGAAARQRPLHAVPGFDDARLSDVAAWAAQNGPFAFCAAHAFAVVICFPATILFEVGAGLAFGPGVGTFIAWLAKVVAACFTFAISTSLKPLKPLVEAATKLLEKQPTLRAVSDDVANRGAEYTLVARLSPAPSWAVNYGLGLAGVQFKDYLPATMLATLPAVATHAFLGASLSSLVSNDGEWAQKGLGALGAASGLLLVQRISTSSTRATTSNAVSSETPPDPDDEGDLLVAAWQFSKRNLPRLITGASRDDGDDEPAGAFYNMLLIRVPFLAGAALVAGNVLLRQADLANLPGLS
ncbi:snare associated Golgi protein-domain-containing protein [Pelagophyceae sp. CCMP2097]|nr:snare associated Golgi protein-domain-containing protein [Pelagophyceae sp. CCMP2097]